MHGIYYTCEYVYIVRMHILLHIYNIHKQLTWLVFFALNVEWCGFRFKLEQPFFLRRVKNPRRCWPYRTSRIRRIRGTVFLRSHHGLSSTHRWHSTRRPGDQCPQDKFPPRQVSDSLYFDVVDFILSIYLRWANPLLKARFLIIYSRTPGRLLVCVTRHTITMP